MSSRSYRNNNPGNLRFSKWTQSKGAKDDGDGYAVFKHDPLGVAVMAALLSGDKYAPKTIAEAIAVYAPRQDNNRPDRYAIYISNAAKIPVDTRIKDLDPYQFLALLRAMISFEGWRRDG
jgi:hypothetical protein